MIGELVTSFLLFSGGVFRPVYLLSIVQCIVGKAIASFIMKLTRCEIEARRENISVSILTGDQWTVDCSFVTPLYLPKHAIRADAHQKVVTGEEAIKCRGSGTSHWRNRSRRRVNNAPSEQIDDGACAAE